MKKVLINPVMRWAFEAGQGARLRYIDGLAGVQKRIPEVGEVLTVPFIVDAATGKPIAVRITRIEYQQMPLQTIVIPVVVPAEGH